MEWANKYRFVDDVSFDFDRERTSVILRHGDIDTIYMKGNTNSVIPVCNRVKSPDGEISMMTEETINNLNGLTE